MIRRLRKMKLRLRAFLLLLVFLAPTYSRAGAYLTINGAGVKRAKIAVGQVHPLPDALNFDPALAKKVREQLQNDLEFENIFEFLSEGAFAAHDSAKDL